MAKKSKKVDEREIIKAEKRLADMLEWFDSIILKQSAVAFLKCLRNMSASKAKAMRELWKGEDLDKAAQREAVALKGI